MDVLPFVQQVFFQSAIFLAIGSLIYGLTWALKFQYCPCLFPDGKAACLWGLRALIVGLAVVSGIFVSTVRANSEPTPSVLTTPGYNLVSVINQFAISLIAFGPIILVMIRRREAWSTAGISGHNLGRATVIGLLLSLILIGSIFFGSGVSPLEILGRVNSGHFWALLQYSIVGFGEEFAFRGFLQTRLIAWLGRMSGWLITSVFMALAHIVQRMAIMNMTAGEALLSSLALVPISMLLGFIMLRTENVVAPALFHTFADWIGTLG